MASKPASTSSNSIIVGLVFIGFLIVFFSLGKGVIDLLSAPVNVIDLQADDQIEVGFLPVYVEQDATADPEVVAVNLEISADPGDETSPDPQPFPTQQAAGPQVEVSPEPGKIPDRIAISSIGLEAAITPVEFIEYEFQGSTYQQWLAPENRAVGWHNTSAGLGVPGNTVLNGHHNIKGMVFRDLYRVQIGDHIDVFSGGESFSYVVVYSDILEERNQPLEVRLANAEWMQTTEDERLTLITCWPFESNTHRVVVVAVPLRDSQGSS